MDRVEERLIELAAQQHQVFSRAQTRHAGMLSCRLARQIQRGSIVACGVQALRFAGSTLTYRGQLMAGLLDLGPHAVVSGEAAAALLQLDGFDEGPLDYLTERSSRHRHPNGTVHSISRFEALDRTTVDRLSCASATLTVVQLCAHGTDEQAANALDSGCRMRLTAVPVVRRRFSLLPPSGRAGLGRFERIVKAATVESWLERRFIAVLRSARLPLPDVQRRHVLEGVGVVRVDFEFAGRNIVFELAGRRGYMSYSERQRKERRRNALQLDGKVAYYFTRHDVVDDPAYVVATVAAALGLGKFCDRSA